MDRGLALFDQSARHDRCRLRRRQHGGGATGFRCPGERPEVVGQRGIPGGGRRRVPHRGRIGFRLLFGQRLHARLGAGSPARSTQRRLRGCPACHGRFRLGHLQPERHDRRTRRAHRVRQPHGLVRLATDDRGPLHLASASVRLCKPFGRGPHADVGLRGRCAVHARTRRSGRGGRDHGLRDDVRCPPGSDLSVCLGPAPRCLRDGHSVIPDLHLVLGPNARER